MTAPAPAPLALTMGDPAGVGGELTVALWRDAQAVPRPVLAIDDPDRLRALGAQVTEVSSAAQAAAAWPDALPVLPLRLPAPAPPGAPDPRNAAAVIESIRMAVALAMDGQAAGVVTNPINKKALWDGAGFAFPGHTEYLAALGGVARSVMMLAAPGLRVCPVTIHLSVREALDALTPQALTETLRILRASLIADFGIPRPRIAVSGLNPHAGEGGAMGREDIEIIAPALDALRAEGFDLAGPLPADTMFHPPARARYDAAVCMLHDQALIPVKTLDFERGVNVTLGLPFIRTSPDHGTAYDIAGKGVASPTSLMQAAAMAAAMAATRGL